MTKQRLFTFKSGGWVVLLAAIAVLAVIAWAVAPAVLNMFNRPPGDGQNIESYRFDLEPCLVDRDLIEPAMLYRDMAPVMRDPEIRPGTEIVKLNRERRGKVLVATDRVIGVTHNGQARAYPIRWLNVHEIIEDTLGDAPIAVTYHWPCDSVRVFDRRIDDRVRSFGVSGLVYNHNLLMYDRNPPEEDASTDEPTRKIGGESLWSQLLGKAITGDAAEDGQTLRVIPATLTNWADWLEAHPQTTVVMPDPSLHKRYRGANPGEYFISDELMFPIKHEPPVDGPPRKERIIAVRINEQAQVYTYDMIKARINEDRAWNASFNGRQLTFRYDETSKTAWLERSEQTTDVNATYAFWFAFHAMYPDVPLAE